MTTDQPGVPAVDRVIHEPARLAIMSALRGVDKADFAYLLNVLGLSRGNLSSHMAKLSDAGYVEVTKQFIGNVPNTSYSISAAGRAALAEYWEHIDSLRTPAAERGRNLAQVTHPRTSARAPSP